MKDPNSILYNLGIYNSYFKHKIYGFEFTIDNCYPNEFINSIIIYNNIDKRYALEILYNKFGINKNKLLSILFMVNYYD